MVDFIISEPSPGFWVLDELGAVNLFLIEGKTGAALIDTGFDKGELPELVAGLSSLPVTLIHTHAHPDHVAGDLYWPRAYIHSSELEELRATPFAKNTELLPLEDGRIFDLGGRTLEVILSPGHTRGSISLLDRENRILITGDTAMTGSVPTNMYDGSLADLSASMDKLIARRGDYDVMYPSHRKWPLTEQDMDDIRYCAALAVEGTAPMTDYESSIITPDRMELTLRRRGYVRGRCSVCLEILNQPQI